MPPSIANKTTMLVHQQASSSVFRGVVFFPRPRWRRFFVVVPLRLRRQQFYDVIGHPTVFVGYDVDFLMASGARNPFAHHFLGLILSFTLHFGAMHGENLTAAWQPQMRDRDSLSCRTRTHWVQIVYL